MTVGGSGRPLPGARNAQGTGRTLILEDSAPAASSSLGGDDLVRQGSFPKVRHSAGGVLIAIGSQEG